MNELKIQLLRQGAQIPHYGSEGAAGADLHACSDAEIQIQPGQTAFVPTGIAMEIPRGYAGLIYARSGLACKSGLAPANKVGVIDSDYRGEVLVALHNHSDQMRTVAPGERIAQLVITPVLTPSFAVVDTLEDTQRSAGGFGSTGK